jgi:hypothetical protein
MGFIGHARSLIHRVHGSIATCWVKLSGIRQSKIVKKGTQGHDALNRSTRHMHGPIVWLNHALSKLVLFSLQFFQNLPFTYLKDIQFVSMRKSSFTYVTIYNL